MSGEYNLRLTHEERFDRIDASLARLDASVARIEANMDRLTQSLVDFRQETSQHLEVIDNRLDISPR
jgi:hypothetical protein